MNLNAPFAIAMWDFSWLERRWQGGGYENWTAALDGLAERGYDAVRIDAYPHLVAEDPARSWQLVPVWTEHDWGSPRPVEVRVQPELNEFIALAAERDIKVALSTWFREDATGARMRLTTPEKHAAAWVSTVETIRSAGLLDQVLYVDLCNEWPNLNWAPFLYDWSRGRPGRASRSDSRIAAWTNRALSEFRAAFPQLAVCMSASEELADWRGEDVSSYDFLEPHIWMAHGPGGFYGDLGYDMTASSFDPGQYKLLADHAGRLYRSDPGRWRAELTAKISDAVAWSQQSGKALVTTECWAIVNWKDGPGLEWDWIKELCAAAIDTATVTGRWAGMATSNFCGPQFHGMWDDGAWHRRLTDQIKAAPLTRGLRTPDPTKGDRS